MSEETNSNAGAAFFGNKAAVKTVATKAEFEQALKDAPGNVLVDFTMEGCGACEEVGPEVDKLVTKCPGTTVVRVDVDHLAEVADDYEVEGTPTLLFAKSGSAMLAGKYDDCGDPDSAVKVAMRKLKCARVKS